MHFTLDQLHFTIRQLTADVQKVALQLRRLSDESVSHLVGAKPCAKPAMGSTPAAPALSHRLPTSIAGSKDDTECMGMDIILSPVAHKAAPPAGQAAGNQACASQRGTPSVSRVLSSASGACTYCASAFSAARRAFSHALRLLWLDLGPYGQTNQLTL